MTEKEEWELGVIKYVLTGGVILSCFVLYVACGAKADVPCSTAKKPDVCYTDDSGNYTCTKDRQ